MALSFSDALAQMPAEMLSSLLGTDERVNSINVNKYNNFMKDVL